MVRIRRIRLLLARQRQPASSIANVTPAGVLAEKHRKMAEPGSAQKQRLRDCTCDGAIGSSKQRDPIRSDPQSDRCPRLGHGAAADRRHQRSGLRGIGFPGRTGGADGEPTRDPQATRHCRRRADHLQQRQFRAVAIQLPSDGSRTARHDLRLAIGSQRPSRDYFVQKTTTPCARFRPC